MSFPKLSISFDSENNFFELSHDNFKNSVPWEDESRHKAYLNVWIALSKLQNT